MKSLAIAVVAGLLALGACNRAANDKEAVRQGVLDYLAKRANLNLTSMEVDIAAVAFRQNEADATVSFRPKGSDPAAGMSMKYTLTRQGNRWVVKGRADAGASPHGAGMMPGGMPPGHPPNETRK